MFFYANTIIIGNLLIITVLHDLQLHVSYYRIFVISNVIMAIYLLYFALLMLMEIIKFKVFKAKISVDLIKFLLVLILINLLIINRFKGEVYLDNGISQSEWGTYKKIVKENSYIIPVNPGPERGFPFGEWKITKNTVELKYGLLDLSKSIKLVNSRLDAVLIGKSSGENLKILGYDKNGKIILNEEQFNNKNKLYSYFLINKTGIESIKILKNNKPIKGVREIRIFGKK
jgi:hypothetical protein